LYLPLENKKHLFFVFWIFWKLLEVNLSRKKLQFSYFLRVEQHKKAPNPSRVAPARAAPEAPTLATTGVGLTPLSPPPPSQDMAE
jgi:hypothetical protein